MNWLRRILPRSLLGRSLLIIGTPLVVVQFSVLWVFFDNHVDAVIRNMSRTVAGEIELVAALLGNSAKGPETQRVLAEAGGRLNIQLRVFPDEKIESRQNVGEDTRVFIELNDVLRTGALSRRYVIDTEAVPRHVRITVELADGLLEVTVIRRKITPVTSGVFVGWSIGSSAVVLIIAVLFMRNQVKPVRRLAAAAESFGRGFDVPEFRPAGAREVRQAASAFLVMRERVKRQMRQRTEMLAGVSHDLRTPLTRMKLQIAMLGDSQAAKDMAADVAEMEHMVEEYLAFARGEGAEAAVELDLVRLLAEIVEAAERQGGAVSLKTKGTLAITARPSGLRRCLTNLLANAQRFAKRVQVEAQRRGPFVEIAIDDDGPGVPPDKREAVFRPFYRLDDRRNEGTGGLGLGLAIARDIARGHGGDIVLGESPLGGLRVIVRLPA
jgi:two-component system, OmpR family, osmolarity sensor histidine kinase EnvZ